MKPVWWLASGAVQIDGVIDLNGEAGYFNTGPSVDRRPSQPGAGGYPGGVGAVHPSPVLDGAGPGGGGATAIGGTGALNTAGGIGGKNPQGVRIGGSGSFGRIRLEVFQNTFTGSVTDGAGSIASPSAVFLPTKFPSVRVVSVAGVAVPDVPDGGFINTDVTIAAGAAAEV